jgi:hypothetical protein
VFTIKSLHAGDEHAAATANPATSATDQRIGGGFRPATPATTATPVAKVAAVAVAAGPPSEFSATQENARRDVLAKLEAYPSVQRAFVTRFEGDVLIVTLAVRGVGSCELSIPPDRFNRDQFSDFAALAQCVDNPQ